MFGILYIEMPWESVKKFLSGKEGVKPKKLRNRRFEKRWFDFIYKDFEFNVSNQKNEFLFFVNDPSCPPGIISEIWSYCKNLWHGDQ
jgi:hypothetical protein